MSLLANMVDFWPDGRDTFFASIPEAVAQPMGRSQSDLTQKTINSSSSLIFIKIPESEKASSLGQSIFSNPEYNFRNYNRSSYGSLYALGIPSLSFASLVFNSYKDDVFLNTSLTNNITFSPDSFNLVSIRPKPEKLITRYFAPETIPQTKNTFNLKPKALNKAKSPDPPIIEDRKVIQPQTAASDTGPLSDDDKRAAQTAWQYFKKNWNPNTGLVNAVEDYPWTTWWDQGSAVLGIHAAHRLNLISTADFNSRITRLLETLKTLPLAPTGLPNKAYSTSTAQMRTLGNMPDPKGTSGWSVLDLARFLLAMDVIRTHYPEYRPQTNQIIKKWKLTQLAENGWLQGGVIEKGKVFKVQEGRLGYEQYAAHSLKLWNINASKALSGAPTVSIQLEGVTLNVDQRNFKNSGASNPLTNDPYLMWGLELGWPDEIKPQALNLLAVQRKRYERTKILTAVNEDSLDRPPYFIYGSVYADDQSWITKNASSQSIEKMNHLSLKAAFAWSVLLPDVAYTKALRTKVQHLANKNRGYFTGVYENPELGVNTVCNVNTNAVVLESIFYKARKNKALALP